MTLWKKENSKNSPVSFLLSATLSLFIALSIQIYPDTKFIRNNLKEIETCEIKINLELINIWGNDEDEDVNKFFRLPSDIKIGKDGYVYIVDTSNHRIQVFDSSRKYVRTIGRKGKGPSDLLLPCAVDLDCNENIIAADDGNYRIQAFDQMGTYLYSFKTVKSRPSDIAINSENEIALYSFEKTRNSGSLITFYNQKGKIIKEIGKLHEKINSTLKSETIFFSMDNEDNIFIAYYCTPLYCKYSNRGELMMMVTFDMSFETVKIHYDISKNEYSLKGKINSNSSAAISVDKHGRVYLVTTTRPPGKKERFFLVRGKYGTMRVAKKNIDTDNTDRYRLLVFNPSGKVIAAKKLNVFCDKIYVHDDTLFIIDRYIGMKIYEYKIRFF